MARTSRMYLLGVIIGKYMVEGEESDGRMDPG